MADRLIDFDAELQVVEPRHADCGEGKLGQGPVLSFESDVQVLNFLKSLNADEGVGRRGMNGYDAAFPEARGQYLSPSVSPIFRPDPVIILRITRISVITWR